MSGLPEPAPAGEPEPSRPAPAAAESAEAEVVDETEAQRMSFLEHIAELRKRLRNAAIAVVLALGVSIAFVEEEFELLTRPLRAAWQEAGLGALPVFHFASPTEPFWVYFKLALVCALLVASPFVFIEIWRFVAPGLYKRERRLALTVAAATGVCFTAGAVFGYTLLCPPTVRYLLSLAKTFPGAMPFKIEATIMMNEVVSFELMLLAGCGVAFELPVILGLLGWFGLVSARTLWRFNRMALVLSALAGGILTPSPDVLSQLLMTAPIYGLYNISILVVWLMQRRSAGPQAPAA